MGGAAPVSSVGGGRGGSGLQNEPKIISTDSACAYHVSERRLLFSVCSEPIAPHLAPEKSLGGQIAAHYAEAAVLFARERDEKTSAVKRSAAAVAAAEAPRNTVVGVPGTSETLPPLPPSVVDSLEPDGRSRWVSGRYRCRYWRRELRASEVSM